MQQYSTDHTPGDGPLEVSTSSGAPGARGFPQSAASKHLAPSATTTVALLPLSRPPTHTLHLLPVLTGFYFKEEER